MRNWRCVGAQLQYVRCDWQLFIIQYGLLGEEAGVCMCVCVQWGSRKGLRWR